MARTKQTARQSSGGKLQRINADIIHLCKLRRNNKVAVPSECAHRSDSHWEGSRSPWVSLPHHPRCDGRPGDGQRWPELRPRCYHHLVQLGPRHLPGHLAAQSCPVQWHWGVPRCTSYRTCKSRKRKEKIIDADREAAEYLIKVPGVEK